MANHSSSPAELQTIAEKTATLVNSNYEKTTVLLQIAGQMPKNEKTLAAYQQVAKTASSDHEYRRVMRALE